MNSEFKNKMINLAEKIDVRLKEEEIDKFYNYMNLLLEWNKKINLTAITGQDEIILKHFIDSMTILKYLDEDEKIVDIGTGAGFPGVPIAILKPKAEVTLLDSLNKRILFLQHATKKIGLENTIIIHTRAEEFGQKYKEQYEISVSRAVANLTTLVEYLLPLIKANGKCICMKGPKIEEEIKNAKFAIKELGGEIEKIENLNLPNSDIERNIIIIRKMDHTPSKYPRKVGLPLKKPLMI